MSLNMGCNNATAGQQVIKWTLKSVLRSATSLENMQSHDFPADYTSISAIDRGF